MKKLLLLLALVLVSFTARAQQQTNTKPLVITVGPAHQVTLGWSATVTSGITGYHVWRSTSSGFGYVQLAATASGVVTFLDNNVVGGTKYYYVVTSFSAPCPATPTCGESANLNEVSATIPSP